MKISSNRYSIVITESSMISSSSSEFMKYGILVANSTNYGMFATTYDSPSRIFLDEKLLTLKPHMISDIKKSLPEFPQIIIDTDCRIFQHILRIKKTEHIHNTSNNIPDEIDEKLGKVLLYLGFTQKLKGYTYIKYALYVALIEDEAFFSIKKNIYMKIGAIFNTGAESVERDIAFAIKKAFTVTKNSELLNYFKNFNSVPSNGDFFRMMCRYIKENCMQ